jgi:hypothetical protein
MAEELIRTNIRLPKEMHASLKQEALNQRTTIEVLVRQAIEYQLSGLAQDRFGELTKDEQRILRERKLIRDIEANLRNQLEKIQNTLADREAGNREFLVTVVDRFLLCLPVPVLIREKDGGTHWKNPAYGEVFREADDDDNLAKIDEEGRAGGALCLCELRVRVRSTNQQPASDVQWFNSIQFHFWDASEKEYIGDLLLPNADLESALQGKRVLLPIAPIPKAVADSAASKLDCLAAFLDHLPVAAAIKDIAGRYLWTNQFASRNIAKKKSADLVGKTTGEVFRVSGIKGIEEQEEMVKTQKVGLVALVMINAEHSRPGLRFPLLDTQGRVTHLGSIGTVGPPVTIQHK